MKKLKSNTNHKLMALAIILLLVISVGYAALSTTLSINGTANIASNSWLVYFTNVQVKDGSVTATQAPTTSGTSTTLLSWAVNLQTPGDFYEYNVDVKNDGTIDAMIGSLSNTSLTTDQEKYLNYSVTYSDGATIEQYDKLNSGETVTLKVRVEFKTDLNPEDLPREGANIELTYSSNYVQADSNAKARKWISSPVNYGVQIYGINEDVDESGNPIGLTFGPAVGDNYNNKYVTHEYEEITENPGNYYVKIIKHTVTSDNTETTTWEYLTNSSSENVTRTEVEKNKYDINMHEMTWTQIAAVSDKTDFLDCMLCGDTKKVELSLNNVVGSGTTYNQHGDGAGMLYGTINPYYRIWNPKATDNSAVGTDVTLDSNEQNYGSNARNAGGYSVSHIRATLIGENAKTNIGYAGDVNLNEANSLYSCLPSDLRNVITPKKVKYVTGTSSSSYNLNDDIADKIWLYSQREMYGTGEYTGITTEGLGASGDGYSKFGNTDSKYYISSYNIIRANQRKCYNEAYASYWWLRSPYLYDKHSSIFVNNVGYVYGFLSCSSDRGLAFGFCIN